MKIVGKRNEHRVDLVGKLSVIGRDKRVGEYFGNSLGPFANYVAERNDVYLVHSCYCLDVILHHTATADKT